MIRHILFSENEAFKLKAFMERARLYMPSADFQLLIQAADDHALAYDQVITELAIPRRGRVNDQGVNIISNSSQFYGSVMALLEESKDELVCFLTTDDTLFSHVDESIIESTFNDNDLFAFSLRLGKNITKNSMVKMANKVIPSFEGEHIMKWDWTKHYVDFSAPLSVHGHYFRNNHIRIMVRACKGVRSFSELEDALQKFMNFPKPMMASFLESKAVSINPIFDQSLETYVKDGLDRHILNHGSISIITNYSLSLPEELHAPLLEHEIRKAMS